MTRFPLLFDAGRTVLESTIIIELLQRFHPGPVKMIPDDPRAALDVRIMDRFFDNYVMTPQGRIVFNAIRADADRDSYGANEARAMMETPYAWLDGVLATPEWAPGDTFSFPEWAEVPSRFLAHNGEQHPG